MANATVAEEYAGVSKLAQYEFQPYWPERKLRICVTGAGGFIASHLAKRLRSEGHYIIACDWKRNEHFTVRSRNAMGSGRRCMIR
jgi:GDP-D-mannose 3', 5'-epimerase